MGSELVNQQLTLTLKLRTSTDPHHNLAADLIDTQATEIKSFHEALARSSYDIGPCMECGEPVVCLPDGMPMCDPCGAATQETEA